VLVKEGEVLVGIFTERDLLRKVAMRVDPSKTKIGTVMTRDPEAVSFHDTIAAVLNKMTVGGFRHVPLVDVKRRPVGVLSMKDIVNFFVSNFPRHVLNVAPDPSIRKPGEPAGAG
jgi:CBS domain-containing protein